MFSTEITQAGHGDYQELHSIKCPYCQRLHTFRPTSGAHGRQSRDIGTPAFHNQVVNIIESSVDKIQGIERKLTTALCSYKGRLQKLLLQKQ